MNSLRAPGVLLLDTNVVVLGWRHRIGDEAVDLLGALRRLARDGQQQLALDLLSLDELFAIARIAGTPRFVVAPTTFEELGRSHDAEAAATLQWAGELATYNGRREDWPFDRPRLLAAELLAPEIVGPDAVLVAEVGRLRADALLTCDYRLTRRREKGLRLQLAAVTPFEVEDWIQGCRQPPWNHTSPCRARLSRLALLTQDRRGLRLGYAERASADPVRAAQ